jgi:hypothetical protein
MATLADPLTALTQPLAEETSTSLYIYSPVVDVEGPCIMTELPLEVVTGACATLLIVYLKVYGLVAPAPVNVILEVGDPAQSNVSPLIVAVGTGEVLTLNDTVLDLHPVLAVTV